MERRRRFMVTTRYSFLTGKDGTPVPFAVYVESEKGRVLYSSGIYVDADDCDIPESLRDFCASSPSEEEVKKSVERATKEAAMAA